MIKNKYPTIKPSLNLDFENTKSLDPRVTFRRGTPGTYYDGVTHVKAEENLVKYSYAPGIGGGNWILSNMIANGDVAVAPDGDFTAFRMSPTTGGTTAAVSTGVTKTEQSYTWSIYAKMEHADYPMIALYWNSSGAASVVFDLSTGTVRATKNGAGWMSNQTITHVGDGWYRCSCTYTGATSTGAVMYVLDSGATFGDGSWNFALNNSPVDGLAGLLVWGPQVEVRDFVTPYTETPNDGSTVTRYQPKLMTAAADHARFDHDPITGESKGLLIEEQRTNLIAYSEDFTQWENLDSTTETNVAIAPNGGLFASKLIPDSTNSSNHRTILAGIACTAGIDYTFSCFLKKAGKDFVDLRFFDDSTNAFRAVFDLSNGTVAKTYTGTETKIENRGNGWYYCAVSGSATVTRSNGVVLIYPENGSEGPSYSGNGYDGVLMWGAQFETGSFPTSYIKTTGASATRSADDVSIVGENFSSWYRQDEGSFEIDASLLSSSTTQTGRFITISDGSTGNRIQIDNNNTTLNFYTGIRSAQQVLYAWDRDTVLDYKFAFGLKKDDVAFCKNNESVVIDSSVELFAANRLDIKHENRYNEQLNGHIKKLAYYPQRLTNEQLQNLTR